MKAVVGLAAVLVVGLILGAGAGYLAGRQGGATTTTVTSATTVFSMVTLSATLSTTTASGVNLQAALNNTVYPDLAITSYSFGKGTLTAWVLNNGSEPFVITTHVPFLNGSTDSVASVISLQQSVVHIGSYLYVPPGSTIIVSLDAGSYLPGQTGVLTIYGDHWAFVYGTQKD